MQSKRFFLFIVLFFSFISSLQPWFFWHIKAGIFYAIVFLSFYYYKSNAVFCVKRKYLILIVLLLIAAISHTNSSFFSIISHIFLILSAISIFSCTDLERASFFDILYKCFAILLTISLGFHILLLYNPQIQISAESETKRSIFREKDKTKRSKKESAQHSKSRNKSFVMTSVSAL